MPNQWGAAKTMANSFVNMAEQGIVMKVCIAWAQIRLWLTLCATQCCVLVANRELLDEELFVDHQYAVSFTAANSGKYP